MWKKGKGEKIQEFIFFGPKGIKVTDRVFEVATFMDLLIIGNCKNIF